MSDFTVVPADQSVPWDDVVRAFGERGDASRCFCQYFCEPSGAFKPSRKTNMAALLNQISDHTPGLLAYRQDEPVGWVQVGPMQRYPRFERSAGYGSKTVSPPSGAWALTCFVVAVGNRQEGLAGELLDAAVDFALSQGAASLDAHPVDLRGTTSRPSGSELYVGVLSLFTRRGFRIVGRTSSRRPVVRRRLQPNGARPSD